MMLIRLNWTNVKAWVFLLRMKTTGYASSVCERLLPNVQKSNCIKFVVMYLVWMCLHEKKGTFWGKECRSSIASLNSSLPKQIQSLIAESKAIDCSCFIASAPNAVCMQWSCSGAVALKSIKASGCVVLLLSYPLYHIYYILVKYMLAFLYMQTHNRLQSCCKHTIVWN